MENYASTEVCFLSGDITLSGTLSYPSKGRAKASVVMVHGSGAQDRDGNMSGFKTDIFKLIAEYLAEQGIASLRYDKRGIAKSQGEFGIAGLTEMVDDASAAIDYVSQREDIVDPQNIFVFGHSEGACLAPEIAQARPAVAGIIMLCASLRSFVEDGVKNAEVMNRDLDKMTGLKGIIARKLFYTKDPLKYMTDFRHKVETTTSDRVWLSFVRVSAKFYRETFNYDVKSFLKNNQHPILAIGGEKDFQCHPDDTRLIAKTTSAPTETHIIDNMDHMLRTQRDKPSILAYKDHSAEPIVETVNQIVARWLIEQSVNS